MYADKITDSMQRTMDETIYRRNKQMAFNKKHGIKPKALNKKIESTLADQFRSYNQQDTPLKTVAEEDVFYKTTADIDKVIKEKRKAMEKAAKDLDFMQAAKLRDEIRELTNKRGTM